MRNIYFSPLANVYIASFMRFMSKHKVTLLSETIKKGMKELRKRMCYAIPMPLTFCSFCGFYCFLLEDILRQVASSLHLEVGKVTNKPIDGLIDYHRKQRYVNSTSMNRLFNRW